LRSTRFFTRVRTTSQRGFALISALVLAVLYFALMELMMIDATRALQEAQRFKNKIIVTTMAESAAELAAERLVTSAGTVATAEGSQGTMRGEMTRNGSSFTLNGEATSSGAPPLTATCIIEGTITGTTIQISWSRTSQ
jgi:Tfp pilus assembly protein PilX